LSFLDKGVKQKQLTVEWRKNRAADAIRQSRPDLVKSVAQTIHQRLANGPTALNGLDVVTHDFLFLQGKLFAKELPYWLIPPAPCNKSAPE